MNAVYRTIDSIRYRATRLGEVKRIFSIRMRDPVPINLQSEAADIEESAALWPYRTFVKCTQTDCVEILISTDRKSNLTARQAAQRILAA